jgi:hypothetical protein
MPRPITSERHTDVSGDDLSEEEAAAEVSREQEEQHNSDCMEEQRSPDPEPEQDEQVRFTVLRPAQEYFTHMETSPLPVKGYKI